MMVELEAVNHSDEIIRLGVHQVTDMLDTGMLLKNIPLTRAMEIIEADDYYKFAVIRDPVSRVISAYTEKFVLQRMAKANHLHTYCVVQAMQVGREPDMDRGITFRQFVEFLVAQKPDSLDPHWIPQHHYLRGIPCYTRIYNVDQLGELKMALEHFTGTHISLRQLNASVAPRSKDRAADSCVDSAVDLFPAQLEATQNLSPDFFMDKELTDALRQYYAEDDALYQTTLESNGNYRPTRLLDYSKLKPSGYTVSMSRDVRILSSMHVYAKGILGLRDDGFGSMGIAIINSSAITINAALLPGLRVEYRIINRDGQRLEPAPRAYALEATIPAKGFLELTLELNFPLEWLESAAKIQITLAGSVDEGGAWNSLGYSACADIVRVGK